MGPDRSYERTLSRRRDAHAAATAAAFMSVSFPARQASNVGPSIGEPRRSMTGCPARVNCAQTGRVPAEISVEVRPLNADDLDWAVEALEGGLGGRLQARRGELIDVLDDTTLVAWRGERRVGLLTYRPDGPGRIELSAIVAVERGTGVGSGLVRQLVAIARTEGAGEIRVTTTNDNMTALAFYQRLGFRLVELRAGAVADSRRTIKPSIGTVGENGIPLRDELELELRL
jgi:ribosomal protein S18 acetylase RimI-like enzyme